MFRWLKDWGEEVKNRFQAVVPGYFGGGWVTEGQISNPIQYQVVADTGPLEPGIYRFRYSVASTSGITGTGWEMRLRNPNNDASLKTQLLGNTNYQNGTMDIGNLKIGTHERLMIVALANHTVEIQWSIFYQRVFPLKRGQ